MNAQSDQKRDAAAAILAQSAQTWPMVTLKKPHGAFPAGSRFYGVPSSTPGAHYLANAVACQCPDYQQAGNICKHVRAVRVFEAQRREVAVQAAPAPKPRKGYAAVMARHLGDD